MKVRELIEILERLNAEKEIATPGFTVEQDIYGVEAMHGKYIILSKKDPRSI